MDASGFIPPAWRRCGATARLVATALLAAGLAAPPSARADRVELADGRVLEGRFAKLPGVAVDPLAETGSGAAGEPILMCDDELTRTMVSKRSVVKVEEARVRPGNRAGADSAARSRERPPRRRRGRRSWKPRRSTSSAAAFSRWPPPSGRVDVVQGITEITPRWTSVEGILTEKPLHPRHAAGDHVDPARRAQAGDRPAHRPHQRRRAAAGRAAASSRRERYDDARQELDEVLRRLPRSRRPGRRSGAPGASCRPPRLLDEILLRGRVGTGPARHADCWSISPPTTRGARCSRPCARPATATATGRISPRRLIGAGPRTPRRPRGGQPRTEAEADRRRDAAGALLHLARPALDLRSRGHRSGDSRRPRPWPWRSAAGCRERRRRPTTSSSRSPRPASAASFATISAPPTRPTATRSSRGCGARRPSIRRPSRRSPPRCGRRSIRRRATSPGLHELAVPGLEGSGDVRCLVQLPPEYDPLRHYPGDRVAARRAGRRRSTRSNGGPACPAPTASASGRPPGTARSSSHRPGASRTRRPTTIRPANTPRCSARLREALRRFSIDTDRVFLSGHSLGGDAAWDIALAHPDLWAGLVAIAPSAGRYVNHYWPNARTLPIYVVGGELDRGLLQRNAMDLDRYFAKGFDATYVEYRGRGHEHFSDEILRIFDWMGRQKRDLLPAGRSTRCRCGRGIGSSGGWRWRACRHGRSCCRRSGLRPPASGPSRSRPRWGRPTSLSVRCGADRVRVWLSPELVDFTRPADRHARRPAAAQGPASPDAAVMLEDLRLRGDRQHPFWAVVESTRGRKD